jgi:hypothetical protein
MFELKEESELKPLVAQENIDVETPSGLSKIPSPFKYIAGNSSIILEEYDRAFSYFDHRDYEERAFSLDFLQECEHRMKRNSSGGKDLCLYLPISKRHRDTEQMIAERLKLHFREQYEQRFKRIRRVKTIAYIIALLGTILLAFSYLIGESARDFRPSGMAAYIYDCASWYIFWTALDTIYYNWDDTSILENDRYSAQINVVFAGFEV